MSHSVSLFPLWKTNKNEINLELKKLFLLLHINLNWITTLILVFGFTYQVSVFRKEKSYFCTNVC